MAETLISNRIKFHKKDIQRCFITKTQKLLGLSSLELSKKLGVSRRTLNSWKNEKLHMSYVAAQYLQKLTNIPIPQEHTMVSWSDHLKKISSVGGKNRIAVHGKIAIDEEYRKDRWNQWWQETGQYQKKSPGFQDIIPITIPKKDARLAEFVGIMLGDGGIAPYHLFITLSNKEKDYAQYIVSLIHQLFSVQAKIYTKRRAQAIDIVIQRKQLVDFCKKIGLAQGNKVHQQVDIPRWIKDSKKFSLACIRGLIDTDGCFYTNSYSVHGKKYSYFKICFTNFSLPLIKSVAEILKQLQIKAVISKNLKDIRITGKDSVDTYIKNVGSHNQKHLDKINKLI